MFVAVVGITSTASAQISERFTSATASEVTIQLAGVDHFPSDSQRRLRDVRGVEEVGLKWNLGEQSLSAHPESRSSSALEQVIAVQPGYWDVVAPVMEEGVVFDDDASRQAVVGKSLATTLHLGPLEAQPTVTVRGLTFQVVGILKDTARDGDPLGAVAVSYGTARKFWTIPGEQESILIKARVGSARVVAAQAPDAIDPYFTSRFVADPIAPPSSAQADIGRDLEVLLLSLATMTIVIGAVSIANSSLAGLMERIPEIGLRRALGALRRHIVGQIIFEAAILGVIGGILGGLLGTLAVVLIAFQKDWTPAMPAAVAVMAPGVGALIGILAGLYPSRRASLIEPAAALRN